MKTLLIYYINSNKILSSHKYFVKAISDYVSEICIVLNYNKTISENEFTDEKVKLVINTEKNGTIDSYENAIKKCSIERLHSFDRVIFANSDLFGPITSPREFFERMEEDKSDVFYLEDIFESSRVSHYFFAVNANVINKSIKIENILSKKEAFSYSKYFERKSNKESYISCITNNVIESKSPFLFKYILKINPINLINNSLGTEVARIIDYVDSQTQYPVEYIYENILKDTPMSVLRNNFHQNFILSSTQKLMGSVPKKKIALIIYIYYEELIPYCYNYALSMPQDSDIYVITSKDNVSKACKTYFSKFPCKNFYLRQMENRGRDVAAYLVAARDVFYNYDYVCCMHDKKSPQYSESVSRDFSYHLFECNLKSSTYVNNILKTFENNPQLGMLVPVFPYFGNGLKTIGNQMHTEGDKVKQLLSEFNFTVPYDNDACAPLGTMFWVKAKTLLPIFKKDWKHSDFPKEPNSASGTLLHAIERFYPFAVQESGFLVGTVSPIEYACVYMDTLYWATKVNIQEKIALRANESKKQNTISNSETRVHFKDVKRVLKNYLLQKKNVILHKHKEKINSVSMYIRNIESDNSSILIHVCAPSGDYIAISNKKIYHHNNSNVTLEKRLNSVYEQYGLRFFEFVIPLREILNSSLIIKNTDGRRCNLIWAANHIAYSALSLNSKNIFFRVCNGKLFVENKFYFFISVLKSASYSIKDKILFLFMKCNMFHKNILLSENMHATDNSYELFLYMLNRYKNSYFVASKEIRDQISDKNLKKHVLEYNSPSHVRKLIFSKLWITSYTLVHEMFPSSLILKDIHYQCIPGKWIFVPHGITCDKDSVLVHKYIWDQPYKTFVSSSFEKEAFTKNCEFNNISVTGYPRMDKWHDIKTNDNSVVIFFTWRLKWSKKVSEREFLNSSYFKTLISIIKMIKGEHPDKHIYYVFHHEVEKNGFDVLIKKHLGNENVSYISFSSKNGEDKFNSVFNSSKYLITDYSSVAYDFAYKKNKIAIYYLNSSFIEGHYPLLDIFYDIHLGLIAHSLDELSNFLTIKSESSDVLNRRLRFFDYSDNLNCQRVYEEICNEFLTYK